MCCGRRQTVVIYFATIVALAVGSDATAQNPLAAARDLYSAAAYEDALQLLNRIRPSAEQRSDDGHVIEQYRAFCLLALGRTAEAESAIESLVQAAPSYRPTDAEVSPHVRASA